MITISGVSPDRIKQLLQERPFELFSIVTSDGSDIPVLSNELAFLYQGGHTLQVIAPKFKGATEEGNFDEHRIDVFLITNVVSPPIKQPGKRPKK